MAKDEPEGEWIDGDKMRGLRGRWVNIETEPNIADLIKRVAALEAFRDGLLYNSGRQPAIWPATPFGG